jgi:putative alpha-1,2-mannosidase
MKHVKKTFILIFLLLSQGGIAQNLIQYVQPLSGTAPSTTISALKHSEAGSEKNANTIPAVGVPFGMTQWTPQTRFGETKCIPPYYYNDSSFSGIRGTHWISGSCMSDYGSFTIMPVSGKLKISNYAVHFSHNDETSTPAYYRLDLPSSHLTTEITSTLRCGMMRFTMQQDDSLYLLIIPNSDREKGFVKIDAAKGEVWGYNPAHRIYQGWGESAGFNGWFFIQFQKKFITRGAFSEDKIFSVDNIANKKNGGAYVGFHLKKGEELQIRIGTSFSDLN